MQGKTGKQTDGVYTSQDPQHQPKLSRLHSWQPATEPPSFYKKERSWQAAPARHPGKSPKHSTAHSCSRSWTLFSCILLHFRGRHIWKPSPHAMTLIVTSKGFVKAHISVLRWRACSQGKAACTISDIRYILLCILSAALIQFLTVNQIWPNMLAYQWLDSSTPNLPLS